MAFPLSLRPWSTKPKRTDSLETSIQRIHDERGHFRNLTEQSLLEEIEQNEKQELSSEVVNEGEKGQDVEARRKELNTARTEMLKHVAQAQNEALTVLDFISLLISKDAPKQAEVSMSPFLKEKIPAGTIAFDRGPAVKPNKPDEDRAKGVVTGLNLQLLCSAADKLISSATRLEKEMEREARYWEQVLSISERGWSVCKIPRDGHTIGVRFGFSEAAPNFSARGLAALRPDGDGNIVLDQGLSSQPKCIRVRLARDGEVLGTSSISSRPSEAQANLEEVIHQARDSLFEEELYQEMIREARTLMSYGVKILDNEIRFAARSPSLMGENVLNSALEVKVDSVGITEDIGEPAEGELGQLAEGFAVAFRVFLTHAYRIKFLNRSHLPLPLSNDKRSAPIHDILRPVLSHLWHREAVDNIRSFLKRLLSTLRMAQIDAHFSTDNEVHAQEESSATRMLSLVDAISKHLTTTIKLTLPEQITHVIEITTRLSAPDYGTAFQLHLAPSTESSVQASVVTFRSAAELCEQLHILVRHSIAVHITQQNPAWVMEVGGHGLRKQGHTRIKLLKLSLESDRLALIREVISEAPVVMAVWQETDTNSQCKSLREVMDEANVE